MGNHVAEQIEGLANLRWNAVDCIIDLLSAEDVNLVHEGEAWMYFTSRGGGELPAQGCRRPGTGTLESSDVVALAAGLLASVRKTISESAP
jgi:hypothetical protein